MKKLALLLALLMLLSCTACGKKEESAQAGAATTVPAAVKDTEPSKGTVSYQEPDPEKCPATEDLKHQYVEEVAGEPSCTLPGLMMLTCKACNYSTTEEIPALGHQGTGANCDEPSMCTVCGEVAEAAWGHDEEAGICKNCGIDMSQIPVPTLPAVPDVTEPEEEADVAETIEATEAVTQQSF